MVNLIDKHQEDLIMQKCQRLKNLLKYEKPEIILPFNSPRLSPVVLVTKNDVATTFCVDFRKWNELTKKGNYTLPELLTL